VLGTQYKDTNQKKRRPQEEYMENQNVVDICISVESTVLAFRFLFEKANRIGRERKWERLED